MLDDVKLFINGTWREGSQGAIPVLNPATGERIFDLASVGTDQLDEALEAAQCGFLGWREVSAFERCKILRNAANLLRERVDTIAPVLVAEQGKTLGEARMEITFSADVIDWFAEEGRRTYGKLVPARAGNMELIAYREPIGPVAAFTPWNFPIAQAVRKLAAALAAGCSIILKGAEETPASVALAVQAFIDAGVHPTALQLVYGVPAMISEYLIPSRVIRKVSFTGSTAIGKHLASLAGRHMKRITLELGGHAPTIIFDDADIDLAINLVSFSKYRNAGQICIAPTRILVQENSYQRFVEGLSAKAKALVVGNGMDPASTMGAMNNARRIDAMETMIGDAVQHGAKIRAGGRRIGNKGFFFEPTVLTDVPTNARIMNEEPFGPVALVAPFRDFDEAVAEANRLEYGLAAYAYTASSATTYAISKAIESGMVAVNNQQLGTPEAPFGGIKDSGYGSEGGSEAMESYLNIKFVSVAR